jgi:hypothetical protein
MENAKKFEKNPDEAIVLWGYNDKGTLKDKNGNPYWTGKVDCDLKAGDFVSMFKVKSDNSKAPSYRILKSKKKQ